MLDVTHESDKYSNRFVKNNTLNYRVLATLGKLEYRRTLLCLPSC